jgi:hypothetical protein
MQIDMLKRIERGDRAARQERPTPPAAAAGAAAIVVKSIASILTRHGRQRRWIFRRVRCRHSLTWPRGALPLTVISRPASATFRSSCSHTMSTLWSSLTAVSAGGATVASRAARNRAGITTRSLQTLQHRPLLTGSAGWPNSVYRRKQIEHCLLLSSLMLRSSSAASGR